MSSLLQQENLVSRRFHLQYEQNVLEVLMNRGCKDIIIVKENTFLIKYDNGESLYIYFLFNRKSPKGFFALSEQLINAYSSFVKQKICKVELTCDKSGIFTDEYFSQQIKIDRENMRRENLLKQKEEKMKKLAEIEKVITLQTQKLKKLEKEIMFIDSEI